MLAACQLHYMGISARLQRLFTKKAFTRQEAAHITASEQAKV